MANGMEMMFKSLMQAAGFDPEKFKGDVEKGLADAKAKYDDIKEQQNRIERKLNYLLEQNCDPADPEMHELTLTPELPSIRINGHG
jgi:hypothetical protein